MTNYLSVVQRAVAALDPNTVEARQELYDRARLMLRDRLPRGKLEAELVALDEAIELIEAETVRSRRAPPVVRPEPPALAADDIAEQSEEESARWREVLADAPKRRRWPIAVLAVLLLAGGAAAFLWLRSEDGAEPVVADERPVVNYVYLRQPVYYRTQHPAGTIIIAKQQNFLYVVRPNVVAIRYGIGVGRECAALTGLHKVTGKEEWPGLRGSDDRAKNRLGARAINFGTGHRIHGTSAPAQVIGEDVDFGCFLLANGDVIELYDKTAVDTRVVVEE